MLQCTAGSTHLMAYKLYQSMRQLNDDAISHLRKSQCVRLNPGWLNTGCHVEKHDARGFHDRDEDNACDKAADVSPPGRCISAEINSADDLINYPHTNYKTSREAKGKKRQARERKEHPDANIGM